MKQHWIALGAAGLLLSLAACSSPAEDTKHGTPLVLSDSGVTLDGQAVTAGTEAVTLTHDIVYYQSGQGEDYGEGSEADGHTAEEAEAHSVVTIRQPGTYRVSGSLSAGQLAIDLGEDAKEDPEAVVTLILDGVDIRCSVAPAVIFYNVYECDTAWVAYENKETESYQASPTVDTTAAGAKVVLADGSENNISGSYVARIYQEGTTKKLHKYDGAFYSKMSINIFGEEYDSGVLNITAENEGLDSELHLTLYGGTINIQAQNDGINTNEDNVSVTAINGGTLNITAGLGEEGDGIDSNGYLVVNGGTVVTTANERSPDGGIDADLDILLNGGQVTAAGIRNDAVSNQSQRPYMELSFASTLPAGSEIVLYGPEGMELFSYTTQRTTQAVTLSGAGLKEDVAYTLTVNGVVQQYTGNSIGFPGGGMPPTGMEHPKPPEGFEMPEGMKPPEGMEFPKDFEAGQQPNIPFPGGSSRPGTEQAAATTGSTAFILTKENHTFSGVSDSARDSGKTEVSFDAQISVDENGVVTVSDITSSVDVDMSHIQITITDIPSEDYSASCLWSEGMEALRGILPEEPGNYRLTISITGDEDYTGTSQFSFHIQDDE